jgi:hypothetical protein
MVSFCSAWEPLHIGVMTIVRVPVTPLLSSELQVKFLAGGFPHIDQMLAMIHPITNFTQNWAERIAVLRVEVV